jgi:hypothetical protein
MFVQDIFLYLIVTRHKLTVRVNFKEKLHIGVGVYIIVHSSMGELINVVP